MTQRQKVSEWYWKKMVPIDLLDIAATNLQFIENIISAKLNKTRYACVQQIICNTFS